MKPQLTNVFSFFIKKTIIKLPEAKSNIYVVQIIIHFNLVLSRNLEIIEKM